MLPSHWNGHAASGDAGDTGADGSDGSPDPDGDGGGGDAGACDPAAPVCDPGCDAGSFCNDLCACEPNTLDVYDADREFRVASSTACSDIALGLRVTWEGRVPMSTLLPESVLLATGDMFDVPRYEAANAYVGAVLRAVHYTRFDDALADYIMDVVEATRSTVRLSIGVSTRGAIALKRAAKAFALVDGRTYCTPDDVKAMIIPVLSHRVSLGAGERVVGSSRRAAEALLRELVSQIEVPI